MSAEAKTRRYMVTWTETWEFSTEIELEGETVKDVLDDARASVGAIDTVNAMYLSAHKIDLKLEHEEVLDVTEVNEEE